jgi:hypothetical protein
VTEQVQIQKAIAQGTLARRIKLEKANLGEMLRRGAHVRVSYQSGLLDGLMIAAQLVGLNVQGEEVHNGDAK